MLTALSLSHEEQQILTLIQSKDVPSYRQAYSDRTAWLMACLSELAYYPFEDEAAEATTQLLQAKLQEFLDKATQNKLGQLISAVKDSDDKSRNLIFNELDDYDLSIARTYDKNGTQALLISSKRFIALVFRGTEADSFEDIKAGINAIKTPCPTNGKIHLGFHNAFSQVEDTIKRDLKNRKYANKPLILAGHS